MELVDIYDKFRDLYFQDVNLYYNEISMMPSALYMGGLSSEVPIDKNEFLELKNNFSPIVPNLEKHIYVDDCQYLVSTVQNLIQSIEYCFVQYFIQIIQNGIS